ncbi:MAG TPA: deoxyribonuclease IV [Abditibacteriaceae bacterium]
MTNMLLGAHLPTAKGFVAAVEQAQQLGCNCLQIFSKSPRQWNAASLDENRVAAFREAWQKTGFMPLVVHDSYLINLAAPDNEIRQKSIAAMIDEVERADALGADFLVTHCGAHLCKEAGSLFDEGLTGEQKGLQRLAESLKKVLEATPNAKVKVALENTAAQGTCLGGPFEHLGEVLDAVNSDRLAVCFDTCHGWAAGHDLGSELEKVLQNLDETVGLQRVAVVHLNDSKGELGKRLDRHAHIGEGLIGRQTMQSILTHPQLQEKPFILETPDSDAMLQTNLNVVRALRGEKNGK